MTTDSSQPPSGEGAASDSSDGSADPPVAPDTPSAQPSEASPLDENPLRPWRVEPTMLGPSGGRAWSLELPEFEGPLDLLLHLVRRHELDILDIPISFVCQKYLEYLAFMRALDLEVAGDYLVMAATLAYLKSRELVPSDPIEDDAEASSDEDGPDPREELIARLLEYQKFRAAAADLDRLPIAGRDVFERGAAIELPPFDPGLAPITLFRLAEAYHRILDRARIHKSHEVVLEECSVSARMEQLTFLLIDEPKIEFDSLFLDRDWNSEAELRSMLVVTLMSLLELTKLGVIHVHQPMGAETILIERKATPEEAKRAISGYDEASSFGTAQPAEGPDTATAESVSSAADEGSPAPLRDEREAVAPDTGSSEPPADAPDPESATDSIEAATDAAPPAVDAAEPTPDIAEDPGSDDPPS